VDMAGKAKLSQTKNGNNESNPGFEEKLWTATDKLRSEDG